SCRGGHRGPPLKRFKWEFRDAQKLLTPDRFSVSFNAKCYRFQDSDPSIVASVKLCWSRVCFPASSSSSSQSRLRVRNQQEYRHTEQRLIHPWRPVGLTTWN